jgi:hypothetical protein
MMPAFVQDKKGETDPGVTEGLLQEIALTEVIQLVGHSNKTGDLELTPLYPLNVRRQTLRVGHLLFREGHLHAAFLADRQGEPALENMFLWEAGTFAFRAISPRDLPAANIFAPTETLMMRGITRLDEWNRARALVPTLRVRLQRSGALLPPPDLHTPGAQILAACDGQTQLAQIAQRVRIGGLRCREATARLINEGSVAAVPQSAGEKLAQAMVVAAIPLLGVAADMFCDDALRQIGLNIEQLAQVTRLTVPQVGQAVAALESDVALVLGKQRAHHLAATVSAALGVPPPA